MGTGQDAAFGGSSAWKLEKLLNVSLIEEDIELPEVKKKSSASGGFTLGDFIKVRKKN